MTLPRTLIALALSLTAALAQAHSFKLGDIAIGHPYARATVAGQSTGGSFLTLQNGGADDRLLSASADVAQSTELHTMTMEGDVMRMRQLDAVDLPRGKRVELKPGSLHVMLVGLKAPLKEGQHFALTLRFEKAGTVTVTVNVEGAAALHEHR